MVVRCRKNIPWEKDKIIGVYKSMRVNKNTTRVHETKKPKKLLL